MNKRVEIVFVFPRWGEFVMLTIAAILPAYLAAVAGLHWLGLYPLFGALIWKHTEIFRRGDSRSVSR